MENKTRNLFIVFDRIRIEKGESQEQFADNIGISRGHYQNCLYGKSRICYDTVFQVCNKLGLHINEVTSIAEEMGNK